MNAPAVDNSDVWAAGGFLSTAEDLVVFAHGVLDGSLLGPEARALLFAEMETNAGEPTGYGLGWRVYGADGGRGLEVGHGGSHVGATARLLVLVDLDLAIAVLTNANVDGIGELVDGIADIFTP